MPDFQAEGNLYLGEVADEAILPAAIARSEENDEARAPLKEILAE